MNTFNKRSKISLACFSLLSGLSSAQLSANAIDDLTPGHWYEVPNSRMDAFCPANAPEGPNNETYEWSFFCSAVMSAWSGGTYDTKRDRLVVWGGGHGDYAGNEVYGFDTNTLKWQTLVQRSALKDTCDGKGWYGGCSDGEAMPDGAPTSRHTYDSIEYMAAYDSMWSQGGSRWPNGDTVAGTWILDLNTNTWTQKTDVPGVSWNYTFFSAYDPITKNMFSSGDESLRMYNPQTDSWTVLTYGDSAVTDGLTAAIDPVRRKMVAIGDGYAYIYDLSDLSNVVRSPLMATGDNGIVNADGPGLVYDAASKSMIAWSGEVSQGLQPQDVYELDLDTMSWTKRSPAADNAVIPTEKAREGTYGRFRYIPSKNAFVLVNATDQNVYFYKLPGSDSGSGGTPTIDPVDPVDPVTPIDPVTPVDPPPEPADPTTTQNNSGPSKKDPETTRIFVETTQTGQLPRLTVLEAHPDYIADRSHSNELVSVGVPLQAGTGIKAVTQLGLQGASAAQFKALSTYPNGDIRWLHVDFLASLSAGGSNTVQVKTGTGSFGGSALAQSNAAGVTVDTGAAKFIVDKTTGSILSSVLVGGVEQLSEPMLVYSVKDGEEYISLNDNSTTVGIEENGPVKSIVRVEGRLYNVNGNGHLWYTARLQFVKGSADLKTDLTLRNASKEVIQANSYDGFGVRFVMNNSNPQVTITSEDGQQWQDSLSGQDKAEVFQGYVATHPLNQDGLEECYVWKPTAAGHCNSNYLYEYDQSYTGLSVDMAGTNLPAGNNSSSAAYAKLSSGNQNISIAQRWMANYFPAGFTVQADGTVDLALHSANSGTGNHPFEWGGHLSREFSIGFANTDGAALRHRLDWPLVARADFDYYRHAKALDNENRMISYAEQEAYFDKYDSPEPGTIKIVDTPSFEVTRFVHWRRHYIDHTADMIDFWRGGHPMHLARALQHTRFEIDSAIAHSDGFNLLNEQQNSAIPYADERGLNKYDAEHQLTRYLPLAYYLSGSKKVKNAIQDYAEDQLFDERSGYFRFPEGEYYRAWLRRFENFAWLYEFTGDAQYLDEVKEGVDFLIEAQAEQGNRTARGQDKSRGFLNMTIFADEDERVIHSFFGTQISGDTYYSVMRILRDTGINYKIEDLEDVILGHAYFLYREMMRNDDGSTSGIPYDYYLDQANEAGNFDESLYVADRYVQHIYDMFGADHLDGVDLFEQAFHLNYVRGANNYIIGMMSNRQQQALMYTDVFRPAPRHNYEALDTSVRRNADGTYTLSWVVPEGAKRFRIKASANKPMVEWLGYSKTQQLFVLPQEYFIPWFAAQNLENEPAPAAPGTIQSWTVTELPTDAYWFFSVHYSTQDAPAAM